MAENGKEPYLALIAARDPAIRTLLDQGFAFVTHAFKAGAAPSGMKARTIGTTCADCTRKAIRWKSAPRITNRAIPSHPEWLFGGRSPRSWLPRQRRIATGVRGVQ